MTVTDNIHGSYYHLASLSTKPLGVSHDLSFEVFHLFEVK